MDIQLFRYFVLFQFVLLGFSPVIVAEEMTKEDLEELTVPTVDVQTQTSQKNQAIDGKESSAKQRQEKTFLSDDFVTSIDLADTIGEDGSISEIVSKSTGISVRSRGNSFSSLSIRGASPTHTIIAIDDIPLSRLSGVTTDLSLFHQSDFQSIELYRNNKVSALYGGVPGGLLNFKTHVGRDAQGHRMRLSLGKGSFGRHDLHASFGDTQNDISFKGLMNYHNAAGTFTYFSDNGTPLNLEDDTIVERQNNDFDQWDGALRGQTDTDQWSWLGGIRTMIRNQGVPGPGTVETKDVSLDTHKHQWDMRVKTKDTRLSLGGLSYFLWETQQYADKYAEIGLTQEDRHYQTLSLGLQGTATYRFLNQLLNAEAHVRWDHFLDEDILRNTEYQGGRRSVAMALSSEMFVGNLFVFVPALRVEGLYTNPPKDESSMMSDHNNIEPRRDILWGPQGTIRIQATESLVFKTHVGKYHRIPTLVELFGDRGFLVGDPALDVEHGWTGDFGVLFVPRQRVTAQWDRLYIESALFASHVTNRIVLAPNAAYSVRVKNIGLSDLYGWENSLGFRLFHRLHIKTNYTWMDSRQRSTRISHDNKRLPYRPRHQWYLRSDLLLYSGDFRVVTWADIAGQSDSFLDDANRHKVPFRQFWGIGAKVMFAKKITAGLSIKNITDARIEMIDLVPAPRDDLTQIPAAVQDIVGYPLPGRSYYMTFDVAW